MPEETNDRTREEIYDDEIAPLLRQVVEVCRTHKMSMLALVEYDRHDAGGTYWTEPDASDHFHGCRERCMRYGRDSFIMTISPAS